MSWAKAKAITDVISPLITMLALLVGGGYALFEYWQQSQAAKAKESLVFVERFYKTPILDAQLRLSTAWSRYDKQLRDAVKQGDERYTAFILKTVQAAELEPAIFTMMGFYEGVGLCARHDWCDKKMTEAFFCGPASDFFYLHYRFISHKRNQWGNLRLAKETEDFVYKICPTPRTK